MILAAFVGLVLVVLFEDVWPNWIRVSGGDVLIVIPVYGVLAIAAAHVTGSPSR